MQGKGQPNIYLIGFMGVGKSAVGRNLARAMRMQFIDSDWAIEQVAGKSISKIFKEDGEARFRELEREFVETGHPETGVVVACGGGLPVQPGMSDLLKQKGVVVCLFARPETIMARTIGNPKRPLLNVENPEERITELMAEREPIYMKTGIGVTTDGRGIAEVVSNITRIYRRELRLR
ncbi:shikimate kinase [Puniceicoccales bacterium CK1056]|uniref:Shikimate kinase n=2 Tax=Oceanipulchritudo coccoides TaxID=2706888 RepID=A0A6B2M4R2_9BACT|nr:shikimate kinase [Oceanipulchritudo coccoides]